MVAALTRIFGVHNLALAEDVVQDAYCRALELWKVRGVPDNPSAWLTATAKNRALDLVRRERTARTFAPELGRLLESEWTRDALIDEAFAGRTVHEQLLRMMFSCCHPQLPEESQLALSTSLSGFHAVAQARRRTPDHSNEQGGSLANLSQKPWSCRNFTQPVSPSTPASAWTHPKQCSAAAGLRCDEQQASILLHGPSAVGALHA